MFRKLLVSLTAISALALAACSSTLPSGAAGLPVSNATAAPAAAASTTTAHVSPAVTTMPADVPGTMTVPASTLAATAAPTDTMAATAAPTDTLAATAVPTQTLSADATSAPASTAVPTATVSASTAMTATAPAANSQSAAQPATASASTVYSLSFVQSGTQAGYRVREQLARRNFPNDAIGTTNAVSGSILVHGDGTVVPNGSKIMVDLTNLQSDERQRDRYIQRNTLETATYPAATFVPTQVKGLPSPVPTSGDVTFQLVGNLTIHGVTKPATWDVKAHIAGQDLTGTATTSFTFEDYGMTPPQAMIVLSVVDHVELDLTFHMTAAQAS